MAEPSQGHFLPHTATFEDSYYFFCRAPHVVTNRGVASIRINTVNNLYIPPPYLLMAKGGFSPRVASFPGHRKMASTAWPRWVFALDPLTIFSYNWHVQISVTPLCHQQCWRWSHLTDPQEVPWFFHCILTVVIAQDIADIGVTTTPIPWFVLWFVHVYPCMVHQDGCAGDTKLHVHQLQWVYRKRLQLSAYSI